MQALIRRKMATVSRALDFIQANPIDDPGFATIVMRLQAASAHAETAALEEATGRTAENVAVLRRDNLQLGMRRNSLRRLIRIARLAGRTHGELRGQFVMPPSHMPKKAFVVATRTLLAAALPQKDLFISLGLNATFFDDLTQALAEYDASTESAHAGRSHHVGARAALTATMNECMDDIRLIDTFIHDRFADNPELLAGWTSASNVEGPFRRSHLPAPIVVAVAA